MTQGPLGMPEGQQSRIVRMNPLISPRPDGQGGLKPPGNWTYEQIKHLSEIDLAALEPIDIDYIADYADLWIADGALNQPIRMHSDTLTLELGDGVFSAARARWGAIA